MFSLRLSPEQIEIRDAVRDLVETEIRPAAIKPARLEASERPLLTALLDKASGMGLRTLTLSEADGGAAADTLTGCIVTEELAAGDPDIAAVLAHTSVLGGILARAMTPAQRERFLPPFVRDERYHLAWAGGAAGKRSGGEWIVDGVTDAVGNAPLAKLFAVQVRMPDGTRTLLVPRDTPGLSVRPHDGRWFHGARGEVTLKDCRVPAENLLGPEELDPPVGGPAFQAIALGIGRAAYEAALAYAQLRVQGGRRIIEHQAIGAKLARCAMKLEVARAAVWRAAWACDHPEAVSDRSLPDLPLATVARVFTSEAMLEVAKHAAECFGAMGVMRDMPLQQYVHDARVCLHADRSNDESTLELAQALAGDRRAAAA